jgi:hypothetical protein
VLLSWALVLRDGFGSCFSDLRLRRYDGLCNCWSCIDAWLLGVESRGCGSLWGAMVWASLLPLQEDYEMRH